MNADDLALVEEGMGVDLMVHGGETRLRKVFVDEKAAKNAAAAFGEKITTTRYQGGVYQGGVGSYSHREAHAEVIAHKDERGVETGKYRVVLKENGDFLLDERNLEDIGSDVRAALEQNAKLQGQIDERFGEFKKELAEKGINVADDGTLSIRLESAKPFEKIEKDVNKFSNNWLTSDDDQPHIVDHVEINGEHTLKVNPAILYDETKRNGGLDNIINKIANSVTDYTNKAKEAFPKAQEILEKVALTLEIDENGVTMVDKKFHTQDAASDLQAALKRSNIEAKVKKDTENSFRVVIDEKDVSLSLNISEKKDITQALAAGADKDAQYLAEAKVESSAQSTGVLVGLGTFIGQGLSSMMASPEREPSGAQASVNPKKQVFEDMQDAIKNRDIAAFHAANEQAKEAYDLDGNKNNITRDERLAFKEDAGVMRYDSAKRGYNDMMKDSGALADALHTAKDENNAKLASYVAKKMDVNKDGKLDAKEIQAVAVAYKKQHGESFEQLAAKFKDFNMTSVAEGQEVNPAATQVAAAGPSGPSSGLGG